MTTGITSSNRVVVLGKNYKFLLWMYCLPLAFDFKKWEGLEDSAVGTVVQASLLLLSFTAAVIIITYGALHRVTQVQGSSLRTNTYIWWFYLFSTVLTFFVMRPPFGQYLLIVLPYLLVGTSLLIVRDLERRGFNGDYFFRLILIVAAINLIWRFAFALLVFSGEDISKVRWYVLGPAVTLLLGYFFGKLLLRNQLNRFDYLVGSVLISIILVSITRGYIIAVLLILIAYVAVIGMNTTMKFIHHYLKTLLFASSFLFIAILIAQIFNPDVLEVWYFRMFEAKTEGNMDYTYITRIAEYKGQYDEVMKDPVSILIGKGMGNFYYWDPELIAKLPFRLVVEHWEPGHSPWTYSLFSGGLFFGLILPGIWITVLMKCFLALKKSLKTNGLNKSRQIDTTLWLSFFILISYTSSAVIGNIFQERLAGLFIGLIVGIALLESKKRNSSSVLEY